MYEQKIWVICAFYSWFILSYGGYILKCVLVYLSWVPETVIINPRHDEDVSLARVSLPFTTKFQLGGATAGYHHTMSCPLN